MFFYSQMTCGFYTKAIHGASMPPDVIEVSVKLHKELMLGQERGQSIVIGSAGSPVLEALKEVSTEELALAARSKRDRLLVACDWTQLLDVPAVTKALWGPYRQLLREISTQAGWPSNPTWPASPNAHLLAVTKQPRSLAHAWVPVPIQVSDIDPLNPYLLGTQPARIWPYYGPASTDSPIDSRLITGLESRGAEFSKLNPSFYAIGAPNVSLYYAYPASYGLAVFTDTGSGVVGGWDGASKDVGDTPGPVTAMVDVDGSGVKVLFYVYQTTKPNISPQGGLTFWSVT